MNEEETYYTTDTNLNEAVSETGEEMESPLVRQSRDLRDGLAGGARQAAGAPEAGSLGQLVPQTSGQTGEGRASFLAGGARQATGAPEARQAAATISGVPEGYVFGAGVPGYGAYAGANPAADAAAEAAEAAAAVAARHASMRKLARLLAVAGIAAVIAAASLGVYNVGDNLRAGSVAATAEQALAAEISQVTATTSQDAFANFDYSAYSTATMPEMEIDGFSYVGQLEIPRLGLTLPIMSTWDYYRLRIAPCRYSGSVYSRDMVIAAHNYDSHFGRIKTLSAGDSVMFTDVDGRVFNYKVMDVSQMEADSVDEVKDSEYDLTLFTCTIGGQYRVVVRCNMV